MRPVPSARLQLNGAVATPAPLAAADSSTAEIQLIPSLFLSFFLSFFLLYIHLFIFNTALGFVFLNNIFFHLFIIYILYLFFLLLLLAAVASQRGVGITSEYQSQFHIDSLAG